MVLVESRRKEATEAFLEQIGAVGLRRSGGERQWVEVYDWRLLEAVAKHEARQASRSTQDGRHGVREIFRKHWVGLA